MPKNRIQQLMQLIQQDQKLQQELEATSSIQEAAERIVKSIGKGFTVEAVSKALSKMSAVNNSIEELSEQDLLAVAGGACGYTEGLKTSNYSHSCCVTR